MKLLPTEGLYPMTAEELMDEVIRTSRLVSEPTIEGCSFDAAQFAFVVMSSVLSSTEATNRMLIAKGVRQDDG